MTTSTFSHHAGSEHGVPHALQVVRDFLSGWWRATPAYLMYRALTD